MRSMQSWINGQTNRGFATRENAERKIAQLNVDDDKSASFVCVQRDSDGRWFPVVINPDITPIWYAGRGVCVWM